MVCIRHNKDRAPVFRAFGGLQAVLGVFGVFFKIEGVWGLHAVRFAVFIQGSAPAAKAPSKASAGEAPAARISI